MSNHVIMRRLLCGYWTGVMLFAAMTVPAAAQIQVTSADPPTGEQGTINLNVTIKGKGFNQGARADFFVSGTTNPGGIKVNSTTFVSQTQLVANIDIADAATLSYFDIRVTNSGGRTGKGTELFQVVLKANTSCADLAHLMPLTLQPAPVVTGYGECPNSTGAGCLDPFFGNGGATITNTTGGTPLRTDGDGAETSSLQWNPASGSFRIVAGGQSSGIGPSVVRYDLSGNLDLTFGINGIALAGSASDGDRVQRLAVQPDGKIVAIWSSGGLQLSRLLADGQPDPSFGSGGRVSVSFGRRRAGYANAIALQSDGKILVAGSAGMAEMAVARLNPDGTLDATFADAGKLTLSLKPNSMQGAHAIAVQKVVLDGQTQERILVGGDSTVNRTKGDFTVVRLMPNGSLDYSFGPTNSGYVATDFLGFQDQIRSLLIDRQGRIVAAGWVWGADGCPDAAMSGVARYTSDGLPDPTFAASGRVYINTLDSMDPAMGIAEQSDGKLVMTGWASPKEGGTYLSVVRFNDDGSLDSSFGDRGIALKTFVSNEAAGRSILVLPDGKIVIAGYCQADGGYNYILVGMQP